MPGQSPLLERNKGPSWRAPGHLMGGFSLPATPSKAKPRRGVCSLTTLLVGFALLLGVIMFSQELGGGGSRTETYYRKALVAKMYFGNDGHTVTATSEEYRSTVGGGGTAAGTSRAKAVAAQTEAAARADPRAALELDSGDEEEELSQHELAAQAVEDGDDEYELLGDDEEKQEQQQQAQRQHQQQHQQQQQQQQQQQSRDNTPLATLISATQEAERLNNVAGLAADKEQQQQDTLGSSGPTASFAAVTAGAPQGATPERARAAGSAAATAAAADDTTTADAAAAAIAAAEAVRAGIQRQQEGTVGQESEPEVHAEEAASAWWSNVVSASGERVSQPTRGERDVSASLATAVTFDENAVPDNPECKITVLDVDERWGSSYGAGSCDLTDESLWPFGTSGKGIDGHGLLRAEQYQYSMEHWIAKAIRASPRYTADSTAADFVFVDMNCYHSAWMAWLHPQNEAGRAALPSPEYYIKRSFTKLRGMSRFRDTKGGDFGMVHPAPLMRGLFSEEMACEEMASVLNMVPERASLCVWTQDSHRQGKSMLLPYAAVSDIDMDAPVVPAADRETLIFFQGGCGDPDPQVRHMFAAGKMLRYALVQELKAAQQADIHAECSCDICEHHMPHDQLMARMSRSVFCPIMPSNTQSSRRLSEAILTGCIPVFVGAPFHTLPLAGDVDYASFALFVNVTDSSPWINSSSHKWEHNHMIRKAWKLDDPAAEAGMLTVPRLADLVTLLRGLAPEEVAARHASVVANRLKFWYPPASAQAIATSVAAAGAASAAGSGIATSGALLGGGGGRNGGNGEPLGTAARGAEALQEALTAARPGQSILGELLMRKMCHRAAAVKERAAEAERQGLDLADSDERLEHPSLAQQAGGEAPGLQQEKATAARAVEPVPVVVEPVVAASAARQRVDAAQQDAAEWEQDEQQLEEAGQAPVAAGGGTPRGGNTSGGGGGSGSGGTGSGKRAAADKARRKRGGSKRQLLS